MQRQNKEQWSLRYSMDHGENENTTDTAVLCMWKLRRKRPLVHILSISLVVYGSAECGGVLYT